MTDLDRRSVLRAGAVSAGGLLVGAGAGLTAPAHARPERARTLARDLEVPWGIAFLPSGDALVGERTSARVHRVDRHGGRRLVGRVPGVRRDAGEGGLLGLALHPHFRRNRWVYAFLSSRRDNRIVRFTYAHGELGRPHPVLTGIPTAGNHNGGRLAFGPDGMLYASTGDANRAGLAQDRGSLAGKILRLAPDGDVPPGNPFGNHVWSYGHRNVEGIAFDDRGRLWATEFGEHTTDELNKIREGHNYGWPRVEGGDGRGGRFHDPFVTWRPTSRCSPSGVAIANGRAWVGALRGEALMRVVLDGPHKRRKTRFFAHDFGRLRTVQAAPDGSLWITTSNRDGRGDPARPDDRVIRVRLP